MCFFFRQKTAYEMRRSGCSSDVCSADLKGRKAPRFRPPNSCADSLKRTAQPALPHRGRVTPFGRGLQGLSLRDAHALAEEPARVGDRIEIEHRSQPSYEQKGQNWNINPKRVVEGKSVTVRVDIGGCRQN